MTPDDIEIPTAQITRVADGTWALDIPDGDLIICDSLGDAWTQWLALPGSWIYPNEPGLRRRLSRSFRRVRRIPAWVASWFVSAIQEPDPE